MVVLFGVVTMTMTMDTNPSPLLPRPPPKQSQQQRQTGGPLEMVEKSVEEEVDKERPPQNSQRLPPPAMDSCTFSAVRDVGGNLTYVLRDECVLPSRWGVGVCVASRGKNG